MKEGSDFFMNLALFTKNFSRCALSSSNFAKRSCTLKKLVNTHTKRITLLCIGQYNICISCVFNGFKYIYIYIYDRERERDRERGSGTYTKLV